MTEDMACTVECDRNIRLVRGGRERERERERQRKKEKERDTKRESIN